MISVPVFSLAGRAELINIELTLREHTRKLNKIKRHKFKALKPMLNSQVVLCFYK